MARSVRPWKPSSKASTAWRPVAARAIFTAFSTASAPELAKNVFLGKSPGDEGVQALGEADVALVRRHVEAAVGEALELRAWRPPRRRRWRGPR